MADRLPNFNYLDRDFDAIKEDLEQWVQLNQPEYWSDFYESNLGEFLIELIAYRSDLLSFAVDRISEEVFLVSAKRYKSALKHAKMLSYKPYAATAASVDVRVDPLPFNLATYGVLVRKGTQMDVGDLTFEVPQDYAFAAGSASIEFSLVEGVTTDDEFISDGSAYQTFTTSQDKVIDDSWTVTVDGVEWSEVEFVELETSASQTYSTEFEGDRSLTLRFGNGINGAIPPDSVDIEIEYRVGGGTAGNLPSGALAGVVEGEQNGATVYLSVTNDNAASGGQDRESLEHIKRWAPLNVRTVDKAITGEDYATEAASFSDATAGAIARASASLRAGTLLLLESPWSPTTQHAVPAGTLIDIDGYDFRTYSDMVLNGGNPNLAIDPNTVDVWTWTETVDGEGYATYTTPSSALRQALLTHLFERSVVTVTPVVRDGLLKTIDIDLGEVVVDRRYALSSVEEAVKVATVEYFMDEYREPGDAFVLSDYYNVIENVPGVDHFVIQTPTDDITCEDNEMIIRGTLTATYAYPPRQYLADLIGQY